MRRRILVLVVVGVVVVGSGVTPGNAQVATSWRAQVASLLDRRADAVMSGDRAAFDSTMAFASPAFKRSQRTWFDRIRTLPLASFEIRLDDSGYHDLAGALARKPAGDEVHVVEATRKLGFKVFDVEGATDLLYLTVVRRGTRWSIVADSDLEDLGLASVRDLWDFGPVRTAVSGDAMVLTLGDVSTADRIARGTHEALGYVDRRWPYPFTRKLVVLIPRTSRDVQRMFNDPTDQGLFVAFWVSRGMVIQPDTFFGNSASFQRNTLSHEATHYASQRVNGPHQPLWSEEGIARFYGERSGPGTSNLAASVRAGRVRRLPLDVDFSVGGYSVVHTAVESAYSFARFLATRYGSAAAARLYRAIGAETAVSFGTPRYHADRAARATFNTSFDALERAWLASIRREFG